jgi:urea carboxylase-associated protein 2
VSGAVPASLSFELPAGAAWSHRVRRGNALRLTALEDGANVSVLLYSAEDPLERYCLPDTLKAQQIARIAAGDALFSDMGRVLAVVSADSCGWHDPLGGIGSTASDDARFGAARYQEHRNEMRRGARERLLVELAKHGLGARDLVPPVNCFSKVTVAEDGALRFAAGHARAGDHVELRAELDLLAFLCSAPHPLDPSDRYPARRARAEVGPAAGVVAPLPRPETERGLRNVAEHLC